MGQEDRAFLIQIIAVNRTALQIVGFAENLRPMKL